MPDFLKKAQRQTAKVCADDERGIAALFIRPGSGDDLKRLGTPGSATADEAGGDLAPADLFGQNSVVVLTDRRLLVFAHGTMSGRVKGLIGEVALADIAGMELDAPPPGEKGVATLEISFIDGTSAAMTPGSRRRKFVEAYEAAAAHA